MACPLVIIISNDYFSQNVYIKNTLDNTQDSVHKTDLSFVQIKFPITTAAVLVRHTDYWDLASSSGRKGSNAKADELTDWLSVRHVSTFIRSSSSVLRKQIQELFIFQCIVGSHNALWNPTMQWNINSSWICFLWGLEDDLINVETCRPNSKLFLLHIK